MFSRYLLGFLAFSCLCCLASVPANAAIVTENNGGNQTAGAGGFFGQSFTTPTGGSWTNIRFNFVNGSTGNAVAAGGLYVLDQQYGGNPNALSTTTAGFLGFTNVISGGQWQFTGLTLNPNTKYFVYMSNETTETLKFALLGTYTGGDGYNAIGASQPYSLIAPSFDFDFSVQGDVTSVPEPSSIVLSSLVAGGLGLRRWRMRAKKTVE